MRDDIADCGRDGVLGSDVTTEEDDEVLVFVDEVAETIDFVLVVDESEVR